MPVDFRTYQTPGVYVEDITPPVVETAGIQLTTLALVGTVPGYSRIGETVVLTGTTPVNELQTVTVTGSPAGGTFTLTFKGFTTASIVFGATAAAVQTALEALPSIGTGNVAVTGGALPGTAVVVEFKGTLAFTDQPMLTSTNSLTGGSSPTITITETRMGVPASYLNNLGVDPSSVRISDRNTGTTYFSGAIGTVAGSGITSTGATTVTVTEYFPPGALPVTIQIDGEQMSLTARTGAGPFTYTITRGINSTTAAVHAVGAVINIATAYTNATQGSLAASISANATTVTVTEGGSAVTAAPFFLEIDAERMVVTARSAGTPATYTVTRGVSGTAPASHGIGANTTNSNGADITLTQSAGADGTFGNTDDRLAVARGTSGSARPSDGGFISVTLKATDPHFWDAALFDDMDGVRERYGDPFLSDGTLNAPLSLAAKMAFDNGASQVILVPVQPTGSPTGTVQNSDWSTAIAKLENESTVDVIVPLSGDVTNGGPIDLTRTHVVSMTNQGFPRSAFFGVDAYSDATWTADKFKNQALAWGDSRSVLVSPGKYEIDNGTATPYKAPGHYAAVAAAGRHTGLDPQEPLTRKQIFGFLNIPVQDTNANLLKQQQNGVLVLYQDREGRVRVRHGLTTNMSNVYTREINIISARDRLQEFIRDSIEQSGLLGGPLDSDSAFLVVATVEGALDQSVAVNLIDSYSDVKYRIPTDNPTAVEVRFAYKPTFPLNIVHIQFAIDTSTGNVQFQAVNESGGLG